MTSVFRILFLCIASISIAVAFPALAQTPGPSKFAEGILLFSSVREGNSDIYRVAADGSSLVRITTSFSRELEPCWSPDGAQIVYQSRRPSWALYVASENGTDERQLTMPVSWSPSWSPDGRWIAYSTGSAIYRISPSGDTRERLFSGANCGRPAWSPQGDALMFHHTGTGNSEIYILDTENGDLRQITNHAARDFQATWSPDGTRLTFASDRDGDLEIYSIGMDGSELLQLTDNDVEDILPAWSPDGAWIAFVSTRDGNREIYLMRPDGSDTYRLTENPGDDMYPAWKPLSDSFPPGDSLQSVYESTRPRRYSIAAWSWAS